MKTIKIFLMNTLFFGLFLIQSTNLYAQDPMKVAPNVYKKVLLDNDKVRVMEVVFAPGVTTAWHSHPNHSVYALTSGKIQITDKGKPATTIDVKMGTALYYPCRNTYGKKYWNHHFKINSDGNKACKKNVTAIF